MNKIKKIGLLLFFIFAFIGCRQGQDSNKEKPKPTPDTPKTKMEIISFSVDGASQDPKTLLDGNKKITVHVDKPVLSIVLKEKYKDLAGSIKIENDSQALTFNASGATTFTFSTLAENAEKNVEIKITASNKEDINLKFKVIYESTPAPKTKMEITDFRIGNESANPKTLLDGNKKITVRVDKPVLSIALKEKYKDLAGSIKIENDSQALTFNASGATTFTFSTLAENVEKNVEIKITASNKEDINLKFKVIYEPYQKLEVKKITVAGQDFAHPFTELIGKTVETQKNSATIIVEASSDIQELTGKVNDSLPLTADPVRPYIVSVTLSNLREGENPILLKLKAKERTETSFSFTVKYTKPQDPPVDILSITIDERVFAKGNSLDSLNNSTVDITKETFDLKVELAEDYAGKKVRVSNGTDAISTKDSNWVGKVATLTCNKEYSNLNIKISADNKLPVTYKVKVNRIKTVIEVFQIVLEENKYGNLGDDLNKLVSTSPTTETINVKKEKVNVKVILNSGETVEKAEIVQESATNISLTFSGTTANAELTLKEGVNNFTLHLEKTVSSTKVNADYKFIFKYMKEAPKFNIIKLKLDDDNKWDEEPDLPNLVNLFVADGDVLAYKKEYSQWNTKATFICGNKNASNKFEYAISKTTTLPTTLTLFTKSFDVTLDDTTTYVFMKISKGESESVYRCELAPIVNLKETDVLKKEVKYLDAEGGDLYAESGLTKKIKIILKPKSPKIAGIELKEPEVKAFTKIATEGKYKNWYEVELPITEAIMETKTINAKYEVQAENGVDKGEYVEAIKLVPTLKDFDLSYAEDFATKVTATFDATTNTYNFTINKDSVVDKKLYLKIFVADYYEIAIDGITFTDGDGQTIDEQYYNLKKFTISDFEDSKSFKLTVKEDTGKGSTEFNVEIK